MQRCVIIEGSPIIRRVIKAILADFGFEVAEAGTGRDGIAAFDRHVPRLAIIDAGISDMSALDVLRHMRNAAAGRVQIIYCTTTFDILDLQRAQAAGATDALIKPFDRGSLSAKLDAWSAAGQDQQRPNFYSRLSRSEIVRRA